MKELGRFNNDTSAKFNKVSYPLKQTTFSVDGS